MERRCARDTEFGSLYRAFMEEYENLHHMEPVSMKKTSSRTYYLSHYGVVKNASKTTKMRVIFNALNQMNFNSLLLVGANLLLPIADVLLRWRLHRYVLIADVEKICQQIMIHQDDRNFCGELVQWTKCANIDLRQ